MVIPAYNEATYIDRLLEALAKQNFQDFEVIVSDAQSNDGTKEVVENFKKFLDIKLVESPPKGPGHGRNFGAKLARGEWLLFLDADVFIDDPNFIEHLLEKTIRKKWSTSSAQLRVLKGSFLGKLGHSQAYLNFMSRTKYPIMQGYCILTKKHVFKANGGFNEKLKYGEDNDYATRSSKYGLGFVRGVFYYVDARRYEQEGWGLLAKNIGHEIYRLTHGFSFDEAPHKYEFGKHKPRDKNSSN